MRLIEKEIFIRQTDPSVAICTGPVSYLSADHDHLLFHYGDSSVNDVVDRQWEIFSRDNGCTWSAPRPFTVRRPVEGGTECYNDMAVFLDPVENKVGLMIGRYVEPDGGTRRFHAAKLDLVFGEYDARTDLFRAIEAHDFGLPGGIFVSVSWPLFLNRDKVLVPAKTILMDEKGAVLRYEQGSTFNVQQDVMVIGERRTAGGWTWRLGGKVPPLPMEVSSRGCHEHSVARLADGRLVTVIRGSNDKIRERPGFKWQSFSADDGETWTQPEPVRYSDGLLMESGSNCPCLFRSSRTGKLYFIGNPCLAGERANSNLPRHLLAIFEVQENPFALCRETMTVIDQRGPADPPGVQFSNFRIYEDRADGTLVMLMTRLGEKAAAPETGGDLYRYRIEL